MKKKIIPLVSLMASPQTAFLMHEVGEEIKWLMEKENHSLDEAILIVESFKRKELKKKQDKLNSLEGFSAFKMHLSIQYLMDELKVIEFLFKGWENYIPTTNCGRFFYKL